MVEFGNVSFRPDSFESIEVRQTLEANSNRAWINVSDSENGGWLVIVGLASGNFFYNYFETEQDAINAKNDIISRVAN